MMLTISVGGLPRLLANPALRSLALAAGAGLGLAAFRVKSTSMRLFSWTAVLYAALAMPLLERMLPPLPIPTPAFLQVELAQPGPKEARGPQQFAAAAVPSMTDYAPTAQRPVARSKAAKEASSPATVEPIPSSSLTSQPRTAPAAVAPASIRWSAVATAFYLSVVLLLLVRFVVGLVFSRRLLRASQTIVEPRVTLRLAARAHDSGLSFVPQVAESEFISVPVTMGALRSTILLPTGWQEWDDARLDAVVAHELSHVARRDALTQRLSLLHRAIFWFSPLAWWLDRHLADLAEQASDEAALSCGADRNDYARTLLGFFEALHATPGRVWWQGVSMAKTGQAEQRLERILNWRGAITMSLKKSIAVVIIAVAIPVVYLAASIRPARANERAQEQTPPPAPNAKPSPEALPEPALAPTAAYSVLPGAPVASIVLKGGPSIVLKDGSMPIRPIAPVAPLAAMPPVANWTGQSRGAGKSHTGGFAYQYGYDDEQRFVITSGKSDSYTMSGSTEDIRHVEKLKKQIPGDFIWFQRDEISYIIRDQATIDRARKFWLPQEELGKKQEALGKQQEVLGKQQEAIGAKMEQIQVKVPDMTAEMDKLRAELKRLTSGASVEQIGEIQSEIGELQSKIGDLQSHAGDQQSKLGEEMGALGEKQGKLGEQQGELGRQQGELARQAAREMKDLLDEAIKKGTAQPEPQSAPL